MKMAAAVLARFLVSILPWSDNWAWGLPLIVLTVVIARFVPPRPHITMRGSPLRQAWSPSGRVHCRHGGNDLARHLPARKRGRSLGSRPSAPARPARELVRTWVFAQCDHKPWGTPIWFWSHIWQLMGAIEALNGSLQSGLTAAFLFGMINQVWPLSSRERHL